MDTTLGAYIHSTYTMHGCVRNVLECVLSSRVVVCSQVSVISVAVFECDPRYSHLYFVCSARENATPNKTEN